MSRLLTGQEEFHDSNYDSYRSNLVTRQHTANDYRFGRSRVKRSHRMRRALRRVNSWLKTLIEAIGNSKLRRIERELEFRGIHLDPHRNNRVVRKSGPRSLHNEVARSCLPAPRRQVAGIIVRSVRRSGGQAIPSRGSLHARPRTEMAGKASARPRVRRLTVGQRCGRERPAS